MDTSKKLLFFAVGFLTVIILVAQIMAPIEYDWIMQSVSALAAQHYEYQWIMKSGFYGFGFAVIMIMLIRLRKARQILLPEIFMVFYGISMLLSGYFDARPFLDGVPVSDAEGLTHSFIATITGIFFTASILASMLMEKNKKMRLIHFTFLIAVPFVSLLFGLAIHEYLDIGKGILQRLLYVVSFTWLLLYFPREKR